MKSIEELAGAWLSAEDAASASGTSGMQRGALELSQAYEEAVRTASAAMLLSAWEAAAKIEAGCAVGTTERNAAHRVTELLRTEYHAAHSIAPATSNDPAQEPI